MNPIVPTALDGVLMAGAVGALIVALVAFISLIRSASTTGWRFLAWVFIVVFLPIVGPASWFVVRRRERALSDR